MASLAHTPTNATAPHVNEIEERRANGSAPHPAYTTIWEGMDVDARLLALLHDYFATGAPVALVSTHMVKPGIARTTHTPLGCITNVSGGRLRHTGIVGSIPMGQIIRVLVSAPMPEGRRV